MDEFARADDDDADLYADDTDLYADDAGDADLYADAVFDFDYIDTDAGDADDGWFLMCSFLQCSCLLWEKVTVITKRNPQPRFPTLSRN